MYGPHWYCAPLLGSTRGCCWYHASAAAAAAANPGGFGVRGPAAAGLAFDPTDSYAPAENAEYGGGPLDDCGCCCGYGGCSGTVHGDCGVGRGTPYVGCGA